MTNKTVRFHEFGGYDVLRVDDVPLPEPKEGEVRIRVKALGISRVEEIYRTGSYPGLPLPATLGFEASGVIDKLGENVSSEWKVGENVSVLQTSMDTQYYTHAEYIVMPVGSIVKNGVVSYNEGAAVWFSYLTAYFALVTVSHIKSDDWVLVTGGSSSTALGGAQLAKALGAKVIITSRSDSKKDRIMEVSGADAFVNTSNSDWADQIHQITNSHGVDIVYDFALASGKTDFERVVQATASKGSIVLYSEPSEPIVLSPRILFARFINLKAYLVYEYTSDPAKLQEAVKVIDGLLQKSTFKSFVSNVYKGIDKVSDAHKDLTSNNFGKIVVEL